MKTTIFKQLIRDAVRDVVRDAVRDIIREELAPLKKVIVEGTLKNRQIITENNRGEKMIFGNGPKVPIKSQKSPTPRLGGTGDALKDLLLETQTSMTREDVQAHMQMEGPSVMPSFNPQELAAEIGYGTGMPQFQESPTQVTSVQDMIASSTSPRGMIASAGIINGADHVGPIQAVPDFSKFMSKLKEKGRI